MFGQQKPYGNSSTASNQSGNTSTSYVQQTRGPGGQQPPSSTYLQVPPQNRGGNRSGSKPTGPPRPLDTTLYVPQGPKPPHPTGPPKQLRVAEKFNPPSMAIMSNFQAHAAKTPRNSQSLDYVVIPWDHKAENFDYGEMELALQGRLSRNQLISVATDFTVECGQHQW